MNSYPDQQPVLNLPPMPIETTPNVPTHEIAPIQYEATTHEVQRASMIHSAPIPSPLQVGAVPMVTIPTTPQPSHLQDIGYQEPDTGRDLIPKEWIMRVKMIMEQTKSNPYEQSEAFNKLKAEYMRQRYNVTIKVDSA